MRNKPLLGCTGILFLVAFSCVKAPEIEPNYPRDVASRRVVAIESDVVVVGEVLATRRHGKVRRFPRQPGRAFQLIEVALKAEAMLKGPESTSHVSFIQFIAADDGPYVGPELSHPQVGDRAIYFLQSSPLGLRCVVDVLSCGIRHFGTTSPKPVSQAETDLPSSIATVLLSAKNMEAPLFAQHLLDQALAAIEFVGRLRTLCLLKDLLGGQSADVSKAACVAIDELYYSNDSCVERQGSAEFQAAGSRRVAYVLSVTRVHKQRSLSILFEESAASVAEGYWILKSHRSREIQGRVRELWPNGDNDFRESAASCVTMAKR
jgi:hypothetical protein